jgi:hypothetical protein
MKIENLPKFIVETVNYESDKIILAGKVDRWEWIGEGYFTDIFLDEHNIIEGEFLEVNKESLSAKIIIKSIIERGKIQTKKSYPYFDGYWGERAQLVFNSSLEWAKTNFKPSDAIRHYNDGRVETIKDGWDHEHCNICWATIDFTENTVYMKSNQGDEVCQECFDNYIKRKSIDFIVENK